MESFTLPALILTIALLIYFNKLIRSTLNLAENTVSVSTDLADAALNTYARKVNVSLAGVNSVTLKDINELVDSNEYATLSDIDAVLDAQNTAAKS